MSGVENGELLKRAANLGFEVVITNDRGFQYEQNLRQLPIAVIVLVAAANTIEALRPMFPALVRALNRVRAGELVRVEAE